LGIKAHKRRNIADRQFRGRQHVYQRMQDLCGTMKERHPAGAAAVIQETCEENNNDENAGLSWHTAVA